MILTRRDLEPRLAFVLGLLPPLIRKALSLEQFADVVGARVPLTGTLTDDDRRALLAIAGVVQTLTLQTGAPAWTEGAVLYDSIRARTMHQIEFPVVMSLAEAAAGGPLPVDEHPGAVRPEEKAYYVLTDIAERAFVRPLVAAGLVLVWDGGPEPRPPRPD